MERLCRPALPGAGLLGSVLLAWVGAGCGATSPWKHQSIYSNPPVFLYREYQETDGKRAPLGYDHPIELSVDQVVSLLGQLKYEKGYLLRKAKIRRVFSASNAASLAAPLVQALKTLSPHERLRFLLARSTGSAFTTSLQGSSGVIFQSGGDRVNIAFDVINESLPTPRKGSAANMEFPDDPTQITEASPLQPFPGATHHSDSQSRVVYPRWLEVEMNLLPVVARPQPQAKRSSEEPSAAPEVDLDRMRKRLENLKRLRDDGTLTQEQYDRAVQEALGEL